MSARDVSAKRLSLSSSHSQSILSQSDSSSPEEFKPAKWRDSSTSSVHVNRCQPSANSSYLELFDEKQLDLIKQLQDEVQNLKYENSELKFLLHVALNHVNTRVEPCTDEFKLECEAFARDYLEETKLTKSLQLSLESAGNMLQESKWMQHHLELRNREQELKIEELQKQLFELKSNELTSLMQISSMDLRPSRNHETRSHRIRSNGRQRSLSTSGSGIKRGLPTILPENYKDSVATLPPILDTGPGSHHTNENSFWMRRNKVALN